MSKEINNKYGSQTKEEAESMARINGIKYDFILETKLIK